MYCSFCSTLADSPEMFEGLGLGSRLSALNLPGKWNYARYVAAIFYAICTPVGVAIGLGVRESYNGNGAKASIISGVLDATSAGILLYTGMSGFSWPFK